jgi:hypothetical protein
METPVPNSILDEAENQSFLSFELGTIVNLEKNVLFQQLPRGRSAIFWRHTD